MTNGDKAPNSRIRYVISLFFCIGVQFDFIADFGGVQSERNVLV